VGRDDGELLERPRAGHEAAFSHIVSEWSRPMLALARGFVSTQASAEEVVQETWLAVIKGLDRFEGRSALRTWVYRILVNTAKSRGVREHRTLPWSTVAGEDAGPSLDPALFRSAGDTHSGGWRAAPAAWPDEWRSRARCWPVRCAASCAPRSMRCPSGSGSS
jgi:RNA polymerase sigma-70 factor (ECF subfamily)